MVNVHIHQFKAGGAVADPAALEQFQEQWATYRKLVESDLLSHRAVGRLLHDNLDERFTAPFSFLDIACGDASMMKRALTGTQVRHYHGLDLNKVNVNGGAVALGHPIGASGARILTTLLYEMIRRDVHRGIAALCLGGGNAVGLAVER